ncbi:MAG: hypothetical protein E6K78_12775 [Candidatus Eisenbacteria bacterium]|uniref:Porin family protein n=1 Tax=Eiseniibacteriota bacterium TaxID=2212470 RepID=A0A538TCX6_UNCEI|nr:MAG: hypothetical protein E6K78_12775 [Candidatus Eisenbacteria bacterium]
MNAKKWSLLMALGLLAAASPALAAGKGSCVLALELGQGNAIVSDALPSTFTPDYISLTRVPEINVQAELWYMKSEDYALNISGGVGFGNYKQEPNDPGADPEDKFTSSSYRVRVGGDRLGTVGERLTLFAGPGLEFDGAKEKEKLSGATTGEIESSRSTFFALSGRIGVMMKLNEGASIVGRIGNAYGYASSSADNGNAKASGWVNNFDATWGLAMHFGASK